MKRTYLFGLLAAMAVGSVLAEELPTAPANLKEAEAQGLQRLTMDELRAQFPGSKKFQGSTGKSTMVFKADGSVERQAFKNLTGKWSLDEKKNAFCTAFQLKKGYEENCFAVFRAPDGTHYFNYDVDNGFYAHVWHSMKGE